MFALIRTEDGQRPNVACLYATQAEVLDAAKKFNAECEILRAESAYFDRHGRVEYTAYAMRQITEAD
jgi:hypothetical protein